MASLGEVERDILRDLALRGPCSIEEVVAHLSGYTWNQIFCAVDRLSRTAQVSLRHPSSSVYHISLTSARQQTTSYRRIATSKE